MVKAVHLDIHGIGLFLLNFKHFFPVWFWIKYCDNDPENSRSVLYLLSFNWSISSFNTDKKIINTDSYNHGYCTVCVTSFVLSEFGAILSVIVWSHFKERSPDCKLFSSLSILTTCLPVGKSEIDKKLSKQPGWTAATGYAKLSDNN